MLPQASDNRGEQVIMKTIRYNDIVVLSGETGSGKTTQAPQFLYEAGYALDGKMIGITEPRRVAAISMSGRVARESSLTDRVVLFYLGAQRSAMPARRKGVISNFMARATFLFKQFGVKFLTNKINISIQRNYSLADHLVHSSSSTIRRILANLTTKMTRTCDGSGCHAEAKLKCPKCINLEIDSSFCSQECFKSNWSEHKLLHFSQTDGVDMAKYNPWPEFEYTGKLRPYPRTGPRKLPDSIQRPDYADHPQGRALSEENIKDSTHIKILNESEIESMRVVCKLAREVLDEAAKVTDVGVTTDEIDRVVHEAAIERDCYPSPLNYYKFPKSCCTSVNEVICHGIPDKRPLEDGDIVNVDITVYHKGFHGDLSETLIVGNAKEEHRKLVQVTWECLQKGIEAVKPGVRYREIGDVIQKHASLHGFSVVKSYCGHGINQLFHTAPKVPHYAKNKAIGVIKPGHTFTIEPMIAEGSWRDTSWPDDWTAVTVDGSRCAQFEETLLATESGCEILTRRRANKGRPYFMDKINP